MAPDVFAFDGFQRWAGRDHLLIRDWLPATQLIIFISAKLGDPIFTKLILAGVASLGSASITYITQRLYGTKAAWFSLPIACFGPFAVWSSTLYQEGTLLCLALGSIALAMSVSKSKLWMVDIMAGTVALTRYEGWPILLMYLAWRRDKRALIALWGPSLWLIVKWLDTPAYIPSPIDYADWNELSSRFSVQTYLSHWQRFGLQSFESGALGVWILALPAVYRSLKEQKRLAVLLIGILISQWMAVAGWIAGLETAIQRMQVIVTVISMPFCAGTLARIKPIPKWGWLLSGTVISALWIQFAIDTTQRNQKSFIHERELASAITACNDCLWVVHPRQGLGTRDRHDGCEILQGVSPFHHGKEFWCAAWGDAEFQPTHVAKWKKRGYNIQVLSED